MLKCSQIFLVGFVALLSCSNSNVDKQAAQQTSNPPENSIQSNPSNPGDGIAGDWKLALETYDDNHNKQLDEAERKKGFSNHYFYRFSADKSCVISPFATNQLKSGFKGHYTLTDKNGKQIITTYWDEAEQKGQQEAQYTVISVGKTELVLLETTGDHTFWIFTRV